MDTNTNNNGYISKQIAVCKTNTKLIEFNEKLNPAPLETYAHLHAQADDGGNGKKIYSNIGIVLQDYSAGKGDKTVRVTANISPDEAQYIFNQLQLGVQIFEFTATKIFGTPDKEGYAKMTKLKIARAIVGSDGQPRKCPWYVEIENGKGKPTKGKTGGTYCQSNTYICEAKVFVNLIDLDFFRLMNRVSRFIDTWEIISSIFSGSNMIEARKRIDEAYQTASEAANQ